MTARIISFPSTRSALRSLTAAAGAAVALASCPLPAFATGIQVIYTKILNHPTAAIPGATDLAGAPAFTEWKGLESLVLSPGGSQWMIKGRTNLGSDLENIVVIGSGIAGSKFVQEGEHAPGGGPDERFEFFGSTSSNVNPLGRFDENGRFAFSARVRAAAAGNTDAPNGHRIILWNGSSFSVVLKQNDPYTGVFDSASAPGGGAPGNETVGNALSAVHLLNSGTVGFTDGAINNVGFTLRPASFYNLSLFHQSGGTDTVLNLAGAATTLTSSTGVPADRFVTTPSGAHWMAVLTLAGSPTRNVLVYDGQAVVQNGAPAVPGIPSAGTISGFDLLPDGHWFAWGTYAAQAGFWALKDGSLIAKTSDPITTGSSERWGNTIYMATGNRLGEYIIAGSTDASNVLLNDVIVASGARVLVRESDRIDLNNNGADDDNGFIGRGNGSSAFINNTFGVSDDGFLYFFSNIRDASGADLQSPSFFGNPNAFLRVRLTPPCRADFNLDGNIDPDDLSDYIGCFFSIPPCPQADFNADTIVDPDDLSDFIGLFFAPNHGC